MRPTWLLALWLLFAGRPAWVRGSGGEDAPPPAPRGPVVGAVAADADADAACAGDPAGDATLRSDPRWLCAAARARCLARLAHDETRVESSEECEREMCDNLPENFEDMLFGRKNGSRVLEPKLFCRATSSLVWHWDATHVPPVAYVVSVRDGEESWVWHDVVSEEKFIIDELPSDAAFQLKVLYVTKDGSFVGPFCSEWVSTLNESFVPSPAVNLTVSKEYQFTEDYVNMTIKWEPNEDDMTCDYKVCHWNMHWNLHGQMLEENEHPREFSALLPNLDFNSQYRAYVVSGDQEKNIWGVERAEVNISTPSCFEVWNNNLTICKPPPPKKININFLRVDAGYFDMNISWIPDNIRPQRYAVFMSDVQAPKHRSELKFVDGNATSFLFKNAKPSTLYLGCVTAISPAGNSTQECQYRKFRAPPTKKGEHGEIAIITIVSIAATCVIMLVTLYLCYRHNNIRRETLQRSQYFENLEKETPKEMDYESTALYFDDEWEIPEDRLTILNRIGGGEFGVVHKGLLRGKTTLEPSENVAVKVLKDYSILEDVRQFKQEIDMMKSIGTHPHIVSIIGCCTGSKQAKLIIEYCALGSLLDFLRKSKKLNGGDDDDDDNDNQTANQSRVKPTEEVKYAELMHAERSFDPENEPHVETGVAVNQMYFENSEKKEPKKSGLQPVDLLSFARQIAMGMEFLASNRIVHRDLAARNVLVCADKTMKISDFGLSKDVYERNVYHKKGGGKFPIKWTAIESIMYSKYTTQSDVWSFGVLLWEIVTLGEVPYPGIPALRLYELLRKGYRMDRPHNCSEELYDIMLSCWKTKPKDRPTFTELHNKLDSLLEATSPQQYLNLNIINAQSCEILSTEVQQSS